jgi:hypothetical protein
LVLLDAVLAIFHSAGSSLLIHAGGSLAGNESLDARFTTSSAMSMLFVRGKSLLLVSRARIALGSSFEARAPIGTPLIAFLSLSPEFHDVNGRRSLESKVIHHHAQDG